MFALMSDLNPSVTIPSAPPAKTYIWNSVMVRKEINYRYHAEKEIKEYMTIVNQTLYDDLKYCLLKK